MDNVTIASLLAFAVALLALKYMPRITAGVPFIAPKALKERMDRGDELLIVDVRTTSEFTGSFGHIPGAVNVPLGDMTGRLDQLKSKLEPFKAAPVFVVCMTANRAARCARTLTQAGFTNVQVVDGGMSRWARHGLPTTRVD